MSKPTCRELLDQQQRWWGTPELAFRVERVLALHKECKGEFGSACLAPGCDNDWPCPTVRLLNGEEL